MVCHHLATAYFGYEYGQVMNLILPQLAVMAVDHSGYGTLQIAVQRGGYPSTRALCDPSLQVVGCTTGQGQRCTGEGFQQSKFQSPRCECADSSQLPQQPVTLGTEGVAVAARVDQRRAIREYCQRGGLRRAERCRRPAVVAVAGRGQAHGVSPEGRVIQPQSEQFRLGVPHLQP